MFRIRTRSLITAEMLAACAFCDRIRIPGFRDGAPLTGAAFRDEFACARPLSNSLASQVDEWVARDDPVVRVAVKRVRVPASRGEHSAEQRAAAATYLRQLDALCALDAPSVVRYYGFFVHETDLYIVMELCAEPVPLRHLVQSAHRLLPAHEASQLVAAALPALCADLVDALRQLRAVGARDRNLHWGRVLVDADGRVRVVPLFNNCNQDSTNAGVDAPLVFMPPENFELTAPSATPDEDEAAAARAQDAWFVAMVLTHCALGRSPFARADGREPANMGVPALVREWRAAEQLPALFAHLPSADAAALRSFCSDAFAPRAHRAAVDFTRSALYCAGAQLGDCAAVRRIRDRIAEVTSVPCDATLTPNDS